MTFTRWKVMAGVLGVSIGGLAAFAGQCPKPGDAHRTARSDDAPKVIPDIPKLPPAGSGPAVPPADLTPPPVVAPPTGVSLPKLPDLAPPAATKAVAPPELPPVAVPKVSEPTFTPPKAEVTPAAGVLPATPPPAAGSSAAPPAALTPPASEPPPPINLTPTTPPTIQANPPTPPAADPLLSAPPSRQPDAAPARPSAANPAPAAVQGVSKFRILLRVGEGEPMFEVRQGDDLMMKVVCEKVDIKSPEKGSGPSAVTATGRVRFVGFGAEGTCEQLSFMAGTGEVALSGAVKIQVKDKLGRVESELTSDKMHYKLDAGTLPGGMRP